MRRVENVSEHIRLGVVRNVNAPVSIGVVAIAFMLGMLVTMMVR
jgi:hypothetical protein